MGLRKISRQELDKILDNHKLWLSSGGEKGERANLSSADLRYADLRYANLCNANLLSADLRSANLHSANLHYADLRSADLSYADLRYADLRYANLCNANLHYADLRSADLLSADLDFSAFPFWCGGLDVHIDDRQAIQLLYHLLRNIKYSNNTSKDMKKLLKIKTLIKQANKFHRVKECGEITEGEG